MRNAAKAKPHFVHIRRLARLEMQRQFVRVVPPLSLLQKSLVSALSVWFYVGEVVIAITPFFRHERHTTRRVSNDCDLVARTQHATSLHCESMIYRKIIASCNQYQHQYHHSTKFLI